MVLRITVGPKDDMTPAPPGGGQTAGDAAPPADEWSVVSEEPVKADAQPPAGGDEWKVTSEQPDKSTTLGQMGTGFMDPIEGGGQLISNLLPEPVRNTLDTFNNWAAKHSGGLIRELPEGGKNQQMQEREAAIQEQRGAHKDNIDWSRMGGDLLNPINYLGGGYPRGVERWNRGGIGARQHRACSGFKAGGARPRRSNRRPTPIMAREAEAGRYWYRFWTWRRRCGLRCRPRT